MQFAYAGQLSSAPLSLLSSLFTLLLVWNMAFSKLWGESLTRPKVVGALVILLGVGITAAGTPSNAPTKFTVARIEHLFSQAGGLALLVPPPTPVQLTPPQLTPPHLTSPHLT